MNLKQQALTDQVKTLLNNPCAFISTTSKINLRPYQTAPALAIIDRVLNCRGYSFVVMFPRQSGKNELQAQIETYLLVLLSQTNAEIIKVSPTWKPQSLNAMRRLERTLEKNLFTTALHWKKESGYIYRVGKARIAFFSGAPEANIVGATASTLLEVDEAQDITIAKFDKDIAPMAASTNATRVFFGTAWTSQTLLARELRAARLTNTAFVINAADVARDLKPYAAFVAEQTTRLGRQHPLIKTQFYSEEIDGAGGLFPPERIALLSGFHPPLNSPPFREGLGVGLIYAFALDVAGSDETDQSDPSARRDSTALTIARVDLSTLTDPLLAAPTYQIIARHIWTNTPHTALYTILRGLIELWQPQHIVIDNTGIGAGLSNFLQAAYPARVIPFTFTASSKSTLGWGFLAAIDSGRFKDYTPTDSLQDAFRQQLSFCQYTIAPGPDKRLTWSVPNGTKDGTDYIHDDLIMSAALISTLDAQPWAITGNPALVMADDPLKALSKGF